MPKFPISEQTQKERQTLMAQAHNAPCRLRVVEGKPFAANGYFGLTLIYEDHSDKTEKAITLFCGPENLEDLERLLDDGLDWFADEEAQAESERLQKEAMNRRTDYN